LKNKFSVLGLDIGDGFSIWFSASYTYGGSKIDNHLHTASYGRTYIGTIVLYACVPVCHLGEGEIIVHTLDDVLRVRPSTGMTVSFPSWLFHETTPIAASDLRVTINIDIQTKKQISIPLNLLKL
jgi:hypothetical protein